MKSLRFPVYFVPLLVAFAVLTACSHQTAPPAAPEVVSGLHVFQTAARQLPETVDAIGTVRPVESATLSSQVMGTVARVAVREGDRVRAGQPVIFIDAAQLSSQADRAHASVLAMTQQVAAAESDAALAASTLKRYQILKEQNSVSPQEFDEVQSRAQAATARLAAARSQEAAAIDAEAAARTMQGYTRIFAPFDGIVTERKVDPGAMASPGIPLLTIDKAGPLRLEVSVDESLITSVHVGAAIPVVIDTLGAVPVPRKVAQIVPAADPSSRSFLVKIDLPPAPGLHTGMSGHALLDKGTRNVLMIPRSAIVTHGSMQSVYVVGPDHIASLRYISTGSTHADQVEILSGLNPGESVIDSPGERELSGKLIQLQPNEARQ